MAIAISRDASGESPGAARTGTLACIVGKDDVVTRAVTLDNDMMWPSVDAIRDHRLLLIRVGLGNGRTTWSTDALFLDLDRDRTHRIGKALGGYTRCTALPHHHIDVSWRDDHTSHREPDGNLVVDSCTNGGWNRVDPVTLAIEGIGGESL